MVFSSVIFLFMFLPISLIIYYLMRGQLRNYWLLLVSLIFFSWSQPQYLWIIIVSIIVNYVSAIFIDRFKEIKAKKVVLILAVIANLGLLFYFKYFNFVLETIGSIADKTFEVRDIILPVGISFFTFQGLSYVIDVYRGKVKVQKNIFKVALYIVMFPQLIAGPIVRYSDIENEIDSRKFEWDDLITGTYRFVVGLGKKVVIANTMAELVDGVWNNGVQNVTTSIAWIASIAYTLQIYYDFSGYSDMAIGLGRMFGFHFSENFNLPYISSTVSEFWRRWHMSLSGWFRDYVYIPMGGNKKRVYLNLAVVFLLTGIWHGAAWTFIVWGLWNGLFVLIEKLFEVEKQRDKRKKSNPLSVLFTLLVVNFGWVLFQAETLKEAKDYFGIMLGFNKMSAPVFKLGWYLDSYTIVVLVLGVFFAGTIPGLISQKITRKINEKATIYLKCAALLMIFLFSITRMVADTYNPFIYFRF